MNEFINSASDPFDSDNIPEFYHCKSLGYGGDRPNLTAPSTPNFPPLTPARYYVDLPYIPDQTDLIGTRPMLIKDVTGGIPLTRVTSSPSTNQYRLAAATRERNYVIEVNSAQAGHVIAYDYYTAKQPVLAVDMGRLTTVETNIDAIETNNQYGLFRVLSSYVPSDTGPSASGSTSLSLPAGTYLAESTLAVTKISGNVNTATSTAVEFGINGNVWRTVKQGVYAIDFSSTATQSFDLSSTTSVPFSVSIVFTEYALRVWKYSYVVKIYRQY